MSEIRRIHTPLTPEIVQTLHAGDRLLLSGELLTARDAAHKRMVDTLQRGEPLPVDLNGQIIYYTGPSPARGEAVIGAAGPTTAIRMDAYVDELCQQGMRGMIGKGYRGPKGLEAIKKYGCVYLAAVGGLGALLSKRIKAVEILAYEDLGTEAIRRMIVEDFPVVVVNDIHGHDYYREAPAAWREEMAGAE